MAPDSAPSAHRSDVRGELENLALDLRRVARIQRMNVDGPAALARVDREGPGGQRDQVGEERTSRLPEVLDVDTDQTWVEHGGGPEDVSGERQIGHEELPGEAR